ncbi:MAG TPA: type II secretion system protein GspN, partial [Syntrophales bacterium]|nr:type II secretion system protein GspN [Syntrophales bacterium]
KGFVNFPLFFAKKGTEKAEIGFENLDIEKCAYLRDKLGRRITGRLGGAFTYDGDGKLNFYIKKGSYQLLENVFGFEKLDFNNIEGQIGLKNGALKISKLTLKGDKISYFLKGDILLNPELKNSVINLSGTIEIASLNNKKMQMLITGTIGNAITRYL